MIYKTINVQEVIIPAGQVIGAPVAPQPVPHPGIGYSIFDRPNYVRLQYEGIFRAPDGALRINSFQAGLRDPSIPIHACDVSRQLFVTLEGYFHSTPLVLYESDLRNAASEKNRQLLTHTDVDLIEWYQPDRGSEQSKGSRRISSQRAYCLLQDAVFTGKVVYHNIVNDRTTPFRWPLAIQATNNAIVPGVDDGLLQPIKMSSFNSVQAYADAWSHRYAPRELVLAQGDITGADLSDLEDYNAWTIMPLQMNYLPKAIGLLQQPSQTEKELMLIQMEEDPKDPLPACTVRLWNYPFEDAYNYQQAMMLTNVDRSGDPEWEVSNAGCTLIFHMEGMPNVKFALVISPYHWAEFLKLNVFANPVPIVKRWADEGVYLLGPFSEAACSSLAMAELPEPGAPMYRLVWDVAHEKVAKQNVMFYAFTCKDWLGLVPFQYMYAAAAVAAIDAATTPQFGLWRMVPGRWAEAVS